MPRTVGVEKCLSQSPIVSSTLISLGYEIKDLDTEHLPVLLEQLKTVDLVFASKEEILPILDFTHTPHTGCHAFSSVISHNCIKTKELLRFHNLPVPPYYVLSRENFLNLEEYHSYFGYPVIVRPVNARGS